MLCGHCEAVCPSSAITVKKLNSALNLNHVVETVEALKPGDYDTENLVQLMRSRRSCRNFSKRPVALSLLEDLVKIGTTAPSGTNSQGWNFILAPERNDVIRLGELTGDYYKKLNEQAEKPHYRVFSQIFGGDALGKYYENYYEKIAQALQEWERKNVDRLFHGATAAIVVTSKKDSSCPAEDAMLATQNILLAAHSLGLGSCLVGFAVQAIRRSENMREAVGIFREEEVYSVIALGYPALRYNKVGGRFSVKPRLFKAGR